VEGETEAREREAPPAARIQETEEEEGGKLHPRHRGCHTDGCRGNVRRADMQSYWSLLSRATDSWRAWSSDAAAVILGVSR